MHPDWLPLLRCPETGAAYDLDATRATTADVVEGFLVAAGGRAVRPLVQGLAVLPRDLADHFRTQGHVYERIPLSDSRVVRFVRARTGRGGSDFVPFDEVVARYGDLVPDGTYEEAPGPAAIDAALAAVLSSLAVSGGLAVEIGCGVGRGVFVLRTCTDRVLGLDRSLARVRRARNVAVTQAAFFLPAPEGSGLKEIPIELEQLEREGCDFAVADPEALPLRDGTAAVVVLHARDGLGELPDRAGALVEAARVLAPGGRLLLDGAFDGAPGAFVRVVADGPLRVWRRP